MELVPNLHFAGDCEEAIAVYEQAFDARRTVFLRYRDANPLDDAVASSDDRGDYVYHAEIVVGDRRMMLNDDLRDIPRGMNVSVLILFDTVRAVERAYQLLKDRATIITPMTETTYSSSFVSLVDRFGIRWELMTEQT